MFFIKKINKGRWIGFVFLMAITMVVASVSLAKEATPSVADPEMEKILNEISAELRCLVCQNQTIADSSAGLAVDLKNQVREMYGAAKQVMTS